METASAQNICNETDEQQAMPGIYFRRLMILIAFVFPPLYQTNMEDTACKARPNVLFLE